MRFYYRSMCGKNACEMERRKKLMKKMNRVVSVVLIILTAIVGFTCKPGLGSQIDVLPPSGEIIYPDAGETPIRGKG